MNLRSELHEREGDQRGREEEENLERVLQEEASKEEELLEGGSESLVEANSDRIRELETWLAQELNHLVSRLSK